jgi:hypothetical protein
MPEGDPKKHFAAVAAAMKADEEARMDEANKLAPAERIALGLRLGYAVPLDEAAEAELDHRALGQAELHMKWRRLVRKRKNDQT